MKQKKLAKRVGRIAPFYVMDLLTRAKELEAGGRSVIHMEVGEPDFITAQPIIDAQSTGTIPNGTEVLVIGRSATNRWLFIATSDGQLAWVSAGLIEPLEGQFSDLPVMAQ